MKTLFAAALSFAVLALIVILAPEIAYAFDPGDALTLAGVSFAIKPRSRAQLETMVTPGPGSSEAIPDVLYHELDYTDNSDTSLEFFGANATSYISNVRGGALNKNNWFEIYGIGLDIMIEPADVRTNWRDVHLLVFGDNDAPGGPHITFNLNNKDYGPWPLSFLHTSGGITGFGYSADTTALDASEYANNSVPDGGFWVGGGIVIQPETPFKATIRWSEAVDLAANTRMRLWMQGVRHRPVQ